MNRFFKPALLALLMSMSAVALAGDKPYFGGKDDVAFARSLWQSLSTNKLVGADAINVFPFSGNQPHGAIQQVIDTDIRINGRTDRVIVKRNHGGSGADLKSVYANPDQHLKAVTVMFKRESGYDEENLNWFWAKYTPAGDIDNNPKGVSLAGRIGKGGSGGCIACHKALGGEDLETLTAR